MSSDRRGLIKLVAARHPLLTEVDILHLPEGSTLEEMLHVAQPDPALLVDAVVFIDDMEIPRENWAHTRPREGHTVTARVVPYLRGGEGKDPLRTLLQIAVIATAFIGGSFIAAAALSLGGNLLLNAIAPIKGPKLDDQSGRDETSPTLAGASNQLRPFGVVPMVLGFHRFRPPLGATVFTEVLADSNHLRMLVVPGYGELDLSAWEIDETPIEDFADAELEVKVGKAGDTPLTLYPSQVDQQEFSILLKQVDGFTQRTSALDGDELSVDLTFPKGLVGFTPKRGTKVNIVVTVRVQFRKVGDVTWLDLPAGTVKTGGVISGDGVTFTAAQTSALRFGLRWKTGERAQWEVRIRRTSADVALDNIFDEVSWTTLRTFTDDDPISFRVPLAKAALNIRATDQLNGAVGTLSVLAKTVAPAFTGTPDVWTDAITNNPAALFRHVLQGPAKAVPVPDAEIDITKLEEWYDFCVAKGFAFNQVRDFSSSVQSTLEDICAAGRAGLTIADGKWSVVIDDVISITTTHITPRNSTNFELEKTFEDIPHAWRFRFPNEDKRYEQDERLVFFDGFSIDGSVPGTVAATDFAEMEIPGVTNPDQVFKLGRYLAATIVNRPERWSVEQDFESIVARRGSRVRLTHDVMVVGLSSGRLESVTVDGGSNVDTVTLDEPVVMEAGKLYGITIRRDVVSGDTAVVASVVNNPGQQTVLTLSPVIPAASAPDTGDLFGFGIRGTETEDAIVISNQPSTEFTAKIVMVPYREAVFDADSEAVPPYVPNITDAVFLPIPEIQDIITDESVLEIGAADTTLVRAEIRVRPINFPSAFLEVQQRLFGGDAPFNPANIVMRGENFVRVGDVATDDTMEFRVRWNSPDVLVPSAFAQSSPVKIIGLSTPPDPLVNLTISAFGGQAFLRWDEPATLDVRFGGTVQFRHSADLATPLWQESASIGQTAKARALFAPLPLKPGSYLARVFDSSGNPSTVVSVNTKQASVLQFANVSTLDEAPGFGGTHSNTVSTDSALQLENLTLIDDIPDFDLITLFDSEGGIAASGTYTFDLGFDLTTVKRVRMTARVTVRSDNVNDQMDDWTGNVDDREDWDGTVQAEGDLIVQVRHTDDDPGGSPTFGDWERLDSAEFEARGFEFRALLFINDPAFNIICTVLGIDAEEVV